MSHAASASVAAYAKLNLSLRVLAREASGFHQIETLFCALELSDQLDIERTATDITLDLTAPDGDPAPDLGPPARNLACRAAQLYLGEAGLTGGVHIRLTKRIPAGAGLGGGSSDAAAVLLALNAMHDTRLGQETLLGLGARLGSDVPFFLSGATLAFAWGRGDLMRRLPPLPRAPVVLAVPPERVATAAAYAALGRGRTESAPRRPNTAAPASWPDAAAVAINDFEPVVFAMYPRTRALQRKLEEAGASIARLTGSGSVVFGVFEDESAARDAAQSIRMSDPEVVALMTHTRDGGDS